MIPVLIVLISAALATLVSFALSPLLVFCLRLLDRAIRERRTARRPLPGSAGTAVLNISVGQQRPRFYVGHDFALAAALSVTILWIPVQETPMVVCRNV